MTRARNLAPALPPSRRTGAKRRATTTGVAVAAAAAAGVIGSATAKATMPRQSNPATTPKTTSLRRNS